ncbi:MAG: YggS family pyridoxal phosphate-dependent enzyme [Gammaproteobacteria bacterium]|nr:YggS family pyridoxal phosphate-dependent enzyme [Gammaproteobacteria bacterium]
MTTQNLASNLNAVRQQIRDSESLYHRNEGEVCLIAASKTRSAEEIFELAANGQLHFGENYVQEAVDKITEITDIGLIWHFIGPIQKNKTKLIAQNFSWVHSIDRESVAVRLNNQRPSTLPALNVCLQINIDNEISKSGIFPEDLLPLARSVEALPNLNLRGLMAIPSATKNFEQQSIAFKKMADLLKDLKEQKLDVDTLSMGMSNDYQAAIACGSTMVRIGTSIFGPRNYS